MSNIRRLILAAALIAGITPTFAQVPSPVPALPDTQRLTSFSITASECNCSVGFAFFADSTDYWNWVQVTLNGAQVQYNDPVYGWTITSPSGLIGSIAQPITNAVLNFNSAQTGAVQIIGARRPRRVSQFSEGAGVPARALNEALTDIVAQNRENWDRQNTELHGVPGATFGYVPSNCPNSYLGFDGTGQNFVCAALPPTGISNYIAGVLVDTGGNILPNSPTYANGTSGVGATLTAGSNGTLTFNSVTPAAGNRVLVKDQASAFQNGVYVVTQTGSVSTPYILTRSTDFNTPAQMIMGTAVLVTSGLIDRGTGWVLTATVSTVGTSPANFAQFSAATSTSQTSAQARQSILVGSVDPTGFSNFAGAGSGLNVNLSATATPLTLAFAAGFNPVSGAVDFISQITADAASFWPNLPPNQYSFLSIDRSILTGASTATQTLMRPQKGPVFYAPSQALLHFDAGNNTDDWGNTWTSSGATYTAGCAKFGALGASLSGTSSYIQSTAIINPGAGPFTIDVWTKLTSNVSQTIFSIGNSYGLDIATNSSGILTLFASSGGAAWDLANGVAGSTAVTSGTFHHIALTWDSANFRVFLDGTLQITSADGTPVWPNGYAAVIGAQAISTGNSGSAAGCFDEFDFVPFARWVAAFTPPSSAYTVAGDWFDSNQMVMKTATAAGPTWSAIQRQYVAEVQTGASSISAIYNYSAVSAYHGGGFSYSGGNFRVKVGNSVYYSATPQIITNWATIGSPITWTISPSLVPPDATAFYVQINLYHALVLNQTGTPYSDCTFTSSLVQTPSQNYATPAAQYINLNGLSGTVNASQAFLEGAGTVVKYPVVNGIAAFITNLAGSVCNAAGAGANASEIKSAILIGYDMP